LKVPATPFLTTELSKMNALKALQLIFEQYRMKAQWDARERRALISCSWEDDHTADEVMSLAIFAQSVPVERPRPPIPAAVVTSAQLFGGVR
jgi:hypothetical protein